MAVMSSVVSKSAPAVVRPSAEPVTTTTSGNGSIIKLSSFDKGLDNVALAPTMLLAFQHPVHAAAETIKRALSQALVHYYPFAGRLDESGSHIQCGAGAGADDGGVVFVAASASCALKETGIFSSDDQSSSASAGARRALLQKLAVQYGDANGCGGGGAPLLLMQVTEFSCGGFVLGLTWNHALADGSGMAQFLRAVGELARGLPSPTVVPGPRSGDSLPSVPASKVVPLELIIPHILPSPDLAVLDVTVPSSFVGRVKAEFGARFGGQACTVFDTVSALMWRCYTRATMSEPDAPVALMFSANVRRHVGLSDKAYYGNCLTAQVVRAKSGTVASGDIIDLIKLINSSKEKIGDLFKNGNSRRGQEEEEEADADLQVPHNVVGFSSWRNLGVDEADFGSGRPARIKQCVPENQPSIPIFVLLPESQGNKGDDGVTALSATVKQERAEAFLRELATFT